MDYAVLLIDPAGGVIARGEVHASDDGGAVAVCMSLDLPPGRLELWRQGRFVGLVPKHASPIQPVASA